MSGVRHRTACVGGRGRRRRTARLDGGDDSEAAGLYGLDVIIVRDDKIAALYVFLDSMPS